MQLAQNRSVSDLFCNGDGELGLISFFHFIFIVREKLDFTLLAPVGAGMAETALSCCAHGTVF